MTNPSLTGIILAGGKSTRFKSPKYLAKIGDKSLLEIAIAKLEPLCEEIIVVSKDKSTLSSRATARDLGSHRQYFIIGPEIPRRFTPRNDKVRNITEKEKTYHPLIGIKEGLRASYNDANVVLACDMPFVSAKMILGLTNSKAEVCLYRYQGRIEPLIGFYRKSCLGKIAAYRELPIIKVLEKCNLSYIDVDGERIDFFNINTKEDLIEAQKIAQRNPQLLGN